MEATANMMSWAVYRLGIDPPLQDKLFARLDEPELMESFLYEVIRLHPSGYIFNREATQSFSFAGTTIEAKTQFFVCPFLFHRDPRYFDDAEAFKIDRFVGTRSDAFMPFGIGPKFCPGAKLARRMAGAAMSTLVKHYRVAPIAETSVVAQAKVALTPGRDFKCRFEKRAS